MLKEILRSIALIAIGLVLLVIFIGCSYGQCSYVLGNHYSQDQMERCIINQF